MKTSKNTFFIVGIVSGIASFASCLADMETAQFILAAICLTSLMLAERKDTTESDIEQH